ncbi:NUDIX hydrolase [Beutenbergia cavernae DSM 12333]|uniref:NUDIX hydrolase n=1 Tax=Beutenbergia cavernae (strain ATCC BAA-8 / DSM 12333 / CCUG 43141 / JCM 11478 / NBRC 16432 / NCIMB 13614 / HKI 0122) TaxID=471853 RepID=C5BV57_BEUC1|nr:NUDIX hydrolase [Beutenbergia cavernae]ACQ80444.1 NUDIX hydrolase [Beutenbergia cavernae DSM 12333]
MTWTTHSTRDVYTNPWIRVREDAVTRPDGSPGIYGVVDVAPAVFVVAVDDEDSVVLVELERYTTGVLSLEVPAGGSDGEELLVAAQRELLEETGLLAGSWSPLGAVWALNGVARAREHVFLARELTLGGPAVGAAEEGIRGTRRVPLAEALRLVREGGITDASTVTALTFAALELGRFP